MDMERNLFDLVQYFEPEDELAEDKSEAAAIERIKLHVFQMKGVKRMRHRGLKRLAVAAAAVLILAGGVVSVDAATNGKITEGIKGFTLIFIYSDGRKEIKPVSIEKVKEGVYRMKIETDDVPEENISMETENEDSLEKKEKEEDSTEGSDENTDVSYYDAE